MVLVWRSMGIFLLARKIIFKKSENFAVKGICLKPIKNVFAYLLLGLCLTLIKEDQNETIYIDFKNKVFNIWNVGSIPLYLREQIKRYNPSKLT